MTLPSRDRSRPYARPKVLWVCGIGLTILLVVAIGAPWIAPHDPLAIDPSQRLLAPSGEYLLGTDHLGRDVWSRLIVGTRTALIASAQAVSIGMVLGVAIGLFVGFRGGWWDTLGSRVADVMQSIPALLLALAFIAVIGDGLVKAMLAVGIIFIDSYFRLTRAQTLAEREMLYVEAARTSGLKGRTVLRNILPNIAGPLIVHTSVMLGVALLIEAMLSFMGVGAQPNQVSWGTMLEEARQNLHTQPLLAIVPGLAITSCVFLFNLTGDALGDVFSTGNKGSAHRHPVLDDHEQSALTTRSPVTTAVEGTHALLSVRDLRVSAATGEGDKIELLSGVSFAVERGEVLGLVGESGSGKSITALSLMRLLAPSVSITAGSIRLSGNELLDRREGEMHKIRGSQMAMVFQDPMGSLSPTHTIGQQLIDTIRAHSEKSSNAAEVRAGELLSMVGVPAAEKRLTDYPHQFSGGMAQRVAIACALANNPDVLIADEPTTALDVTIQAQVLDLLRDLTQRMNMSLMLITHDMGVVASTCDRVAVMYAGQIVEQGDISQIFSAPHHPYTEALLAAMPKEGAKEERLRIIPGLVPAPSDWPKGCRFHPRCPYSVTECEIGPIEEIDRSLCIRTRELHLQGVDE